MVRSGVLRMSKIRINELARELEVKPNVILELLPELGVTDKKTHSSSLDDEVVLNLRRRVTGTGASEETEDHEPTAHQEPANQSVAPSAESAQKITNNAPAAAPQEPVRPSASTPAESFEL